MRKTDAAILVVVAVLLTAAFFVFPYQAFTQGAWGSRVSLGGSTAGLFADVDPNNMLYTNPGELSYTTDSVSIGTILPGVSIQSQPKMGTTAPASPQVTCTGTTGTLLALNTNRIAADITLIGAPGTATVSVCRTATCTTATAAFIFTTQGQSYREEHFNGVYSCITSTGSIVMAASEVTP